MSWATDHVKQFRACADAEKIVAVRGGAKR